jgi:glycerol-1-phosphate dehydrogenase [NAD(P)+]
MTAFENARFPLTVAEGAATERLGELAAGAVVCTMPEPWALVADVVPAPLWMIQAGSVELAHLRDLAAGVPPGGRAVVGLGGGSALDTAKFVAEATGLDLVQIPTILSADAAFTAPYGYRDGSRVRYGGDLRPVEVIVDPALVRRAPPRLNRAGVGDLLSCHTGMFDWRLAVHEGRGEIPWNPEAAALGRRVLDELAAMAPEIRRVSDAAIRWLAEIHRDVGAGCIAYGARFEEGSEHFLAYCLEWLTRRSWVHGELISWCVVVMSLLQGNEPERAADLVRATGVDADPEHLRIDEDLAVRALLELPGYCAREALWPSVVEHLQLDDAEARRVVRRARELIV